jgi:hypothetical protein
VTTWKQQTSIHHENKTHRIIDLNLASLSAVLPLLPFPITPPNKMTELFRAKVLHDFAPSEEDELALTKGTVIAILECNGSWWRAKNEQGQEGILPSNYVERIHEAQEAPPVIPPRRPTRTSTAASVTAPPKTKRPERTASRRTSSIVAGITTTPWDFNSCNINMAEPVWRKKGFSELMLDGFYSKAQQPGPSISARGVSATAPTSSAASSAKPLLPHESRRLEFARVKQSMHLGKFGGDSTSTVP